MVRKAENVDNLTKLIEIYANYIGHRNIMPHSYVDIMLQKALDLGHPETMFDILKFH
jgi:hypothetical protein